MSLVSICISTRNRAAKLERHLRHIAGFQELNYEVVVSDNQSEDDTSAVVKRMRAVLPRLHYVRQPKPLGSWESISAGCANAAGDYVIWIADDDFLIEEGVLYAQQVMDREPDISAVFAQWRDYFEDTGEIGNITQFFPEEKSYSQADMVKLYSDYWILELPIFRRSVAMKWMTPLALQMPLDFHAISCFLRHGRIQMIPKTIAHVTRHPGQQSRLIYEKDYMFSHISDLELYIQGIPAYARPRNDGMLAQKVVSHYLWCALRAREDGKFFLARQYLLKAMSYGQDPGREEAAAFQRDHMMSLILEYLDQLAQVAHPVPEMVFEDQGLACTLAESYMARHPDVSVRLVPRDDLVTEPFPADTMIMVNDTATTAARREHQGGPTRKLRAISDIVEVCRLI
ncbi:glycosyltransferase family A protein [Azospirillum griseum]|uniref:glycosyltransferase family A protein n=1 Tax=Azospirillum griseum TaxID=2496639 RepID=UPI001315563F|nr:glycosyltransferase family A protein [Azospirillum griseum]